MGFINMQICGDKLPLCGGTHLLPALHPSPTFPHLTPLWKGGHSFIAKIISNAPFYPSNYVMAPTLIGGIQKYESLLAVVPMPAARNPCLALCSAVVSPVGHAGWG